MTLKTNPCEGSDGTTVTTANSDDNGGTAFDLVNIGAGTIMAYETTGAIHGTSSIRMQSSTAASTVQVGWTDTGATSLVVRWYENFTTLPTALQQHGFNARGNAGATSLSRMEINTDGTVRAVVSSTAGTSADALSTGVTYRFEAVVTGLNGSSGACTVTVYVGESTTAYTTATITGVTTSLTADTIRFGKFNGSGNFDALFDSIAANIGTSTPIGPIGGDLSVNAEAATVAAAANTPQASVKASADVAAATGAALFDPTDGTISVTLTGEDAVNVIVTAPDPTAVVASVALGEVAAAAAAAEAATGSVGPSAEVAAVAAAAVDATTKTSPTQDVAAVAAAAADASGSIAPSATTAAVTAAAEDATVTRAGNPLADVAAVAAVAHDGSAHVAASAEAALVIAVAADAIVSTAGQVSVVPTSADVTVTAEDPSVSISQPGPAEAAEVTAAALDAAGSSSRSIDAEAAEVTAAAEDATATRADNMLAPAEAAEVAVTVEGAPAITPSAEAAETVVTADDVQPYTEVSVHPFAAEVTVSADDATVSTDVLTAPDAGAGDVAAAALDAAIAVLTAAEAAVVSAAAVDPSIQGPPRAGALRAGPRGRPTLRPARRVEVSA